MAIPFGGIWGLFYNNEAVGAPDGVTLSLAVGNGAPDGVDLYAYCSLTNLHGHRDYTSTQWKLYKTVATDNEIDAIFSYYSNPANLPLGVLQEFEIRKIWENDLGNTPTDLKMGVLEDSDEGDETDYYPYPTKTDYISYTLEGGDAVSGTQSEQVYKSGYTICVPIIVPGSGSERPYYNFNCEAVRVWASKFAKVKMDLLSTDKIFLDNFMPIIDEPTSGIIDYYVGNDDATKLLSWADQMNTTVTLINGQKSLDGCIVNRLDWYSDNPTYQKTITEYWQSLETCYIDGAWVEDTWMYYTRYQQIQYWWDWIQSFKNAGWKMLFGVHDCAYFDFSESSDREAAWRLMNLIGDTNCYFYMNDSYQSAMQNASQYSDEYGSADTIPYEYGSIWYRRFSAVDRKLSFDDSQSDHPPALNYSALKRGLFA